MRRITLRGLLAMAAALFATLATVVLASAEISPNPL